MSIRWPNHVLVFIKYNGKSVKYLEGKLFLGKVVYLGGDSNLRIHYYRFNINSIATGTDYRELLLFAFGSAFEVKLAVLYLVGEFVYTFSTYRNDQIGIAAPYFKDTLLSSTPLTPVVAVSGWFYLYTHGKQI